MSTVHCKPITISIKLRAHTGLELWTRKVGRGTLEVIRWRTLTAGGDNEGRSTLEIDTKLINGM